MWTILRGLKPNIETASFMILSLKAVIKNNIIFA